MIISKISSIRNGHGGDIFFKGITKEFGTNPFVISNTEPYKMMSPEPELEERMSPRIETKSKYNGSVGGAPSL